MNVFFIAGQPRSRTAWLANFLTHRDSFCFHEAIKRCPTPHDMRLLFEEVQKTTGVGSVGDSDSGIPFIIDEVLFEFPSARLVVIERKQVDVIKSFKKTFPQISDGDVARLIGKTQLALERLKKKHTPLVLDFEALADEGAMKELWDHCLPHTPFDRERWAMLEGLKVEIIPERYLADYPPEAAQRIRGLVLNYR